MGFSTPSLREEISRWRDRDAIPHLWWRDDDAVSWTPSLEQLLDCGARHNFNISLSVIPAHLDMSLAERLAGLSGVEVWQHGYSHEDHGGGSEFGEGRPLDRLQEDARRGTEAMDSVFGEDGWSKIFVPPWGRLAQNFKPVLKMMGYAGISCSGRSRSFPGLREYNATLDIFDWDEAGRARFRGDDTCLEDLIRQLKHRRTSGLVDQPIGILTHHLVHDATAWAGLERFFGALSECGHNVLRADTFRLIDYALGPSQSASPAIH